MADDKDKNDSKKPETAKENPDETAEEKTIGKEPEKQTTKPEEKETERSRVQSMEPQRLTFWQCWTVTKNAGLRLLVATHLAKRSNSFACCGWHFSNFMGNPLDLRYSNLRSHYCTIHWFHLDG